jgi:uncharacterized protein involved in exopolysaccharide biosynthesis
VNTTSADSGHPEHPSEPDADEVSLIRLLNILLRYRWLLVLLPVVLGLGLGMATRMQPRSYAAHASFMPQRGASSQPAVMGALARQLGVNVGTDRDTETPQFYSRLLNSREVLWQAVISEYDLDEEVGTASRGTLLDLWDDDAAMDRELQHRVVTRLRGQLSVSIDRETGMVGLTVLSRSPALAEQIAARLIDLVNVYNLETRQSRAHAEREFVEARLLEAQAELSEAESELQVFLRQNRMFRNAPELVFEHDRLQRQVSLRQELVSTLSQAREQARIDAVRETPVITVVEAASGSARPHPRGTVTRAVLGGLTGLGLAILLAFLLEFLRRSRRADNAAYREFNTLRTTAWEEIRSPTRLLKRPRRVSKRSG